MRAAVMEAPCASVEPRSSSRPVLLVQLSPNPKDLYSYFPAFHQLLIMLPLNMEVEEAILFLTAMTFIIAVGGATAQG